MHIEKKRTDLVNILSEIICFLAREVSRSKQEKNINLVFLPDNKN